VTHWISIAFFLGLLVALAVILELTVKAHWAAIVAALRGVAPAEPVQAAPRQERRAAA